MSIVRNTPIVETKLAASTLDEGMAVTFAGNIATKTATNDILHAVSNESTVSASYGDFVLKGSGVSLRVKLGSGATAGQELYASSSGFFFPSASYKSANALCLESGSVGSLVEAVLF